MATEITLTVEQKAILEEFARCRNNPQWLWVRAQLLLSLYAGTSIKETARRFHLARNTVRLWLRRWNAASANLIVCEDPETDALPLSQQIEGILADLPRQGKPPTFCPEEVVQIVVLACEEPQKFGRPISHWTARELAEEAIQQGIVPCISPRSVGRLLKGVQSSTASQPLLAKPQHRRPRTLLSTSRNHL
jgi:transposase